ncbi:MAG: hypothetical protein JWP86_2055 [Phenylobacterium sp.]|nr:hypothetical protein [Phenylobacterium sp.]
MKILRIANLRIGLGVLVGVYGLSNLLPIASNVAYKAGALGQPTGAMARMVALWDATAWWQLGLWTAVVAVLMLVAWRLVCGRPALGLYVATLAADAALWWVMQSGAAYQQVFTPADVQMDYDMLLAMAVVGVLIWWVERRPGATAASA